MRMQPDFEKANEIYFRLGIIYKQQQKYSQSLEVFDILRYQKSDGINTDLHSSALSTLSAILRDR